MESNLEEVYVSEHQYLEAVKLAHQMQILCVVKQQVAGSVPILVLKDNAETFKGILTAYKVAYEPGYSTRNFDGTNLN